MILRTFRTTANPSMLAAYERFEETEGIPMVRSMPGCVAAGFGRIAGASDPSYIFFSVWTDAASIEAARATPKWKQTVAKLESSKFTVGEAVVEQFDLRAYGSLEMASAVSRH